MSPEVKQSIATQHVFNHKFEHIAVKSKKEKFRTFQVRLHMTSHVGVVTSVCLTPPRAHPQTSNHL